MLILVTGFVSMVPLFSGVISPQGPKIDLSLSFCVGETFVSSDKDKRYNVCVGFSRDIAFLTRLCCLRGF